MNTKTRKHLKSSLLFVLPVVMASLVGMARQADGALVASWDFYEGTGTSAAANEPGIDAATFGSHGSGSLPSWVVGDGAPVPGASDSNAIHFGGVDFSNGGYAVVTTDNVFNFNVTGSFSVGTWLKMDVPTNTTGLVNTLNSPSFHGWGLTAFNDGRIKLEVNPGVSGNPGIEHNATSLMNGTDWFHVAATYDNQNIRLYLNGTLANQGTVNLGTATAFPDNDLYFGSYGTSPLTRFFNGSMDGVRIFDHALSVAEVRELFSSVWTGGSGNWHDAAKWSPAGVPGAGAAATIPAGNPRISDSRSVGYVMVDAGASLELSGGITVVGDALSLSGGGTANIGALRNVSGNNEWAGPVTMLAGPTNFIGSDAGTLTLSGPVTYSGSQLNAFLVGRGDGNIIISGSITGGTVDGESIARSSNGTGTLTLSGTNTYLGYTRINGGTLSVAGGSAIPDSSRIWLHGSGTLDLQADETIGSLDSTSTSTGVTLGANTLTTGGDGTNREFRGVISGTGGLTKLGAGIQTLTNANTYFGATRIEDDGTLQLTGAGAIGNSALIHIANTDATFDVSAKAGGFSLGAGQTLKGIGSVEVGGNTLTLEGTLEPGNSIGTLTIGGDLTLGSTSLSSFEVAGWDSGEYDLVRGSGLYSDETVTFGGTLDVEFDPSVWLGSATIYDFNHYAGDFADFTYSGLAGWMTASFDPTTGVLSVVPEPGTWMLLLMALVCALPARRRRN